MKLFPLLVIAIVLLGCFMVGVNSEDSNVDSSVYSALDKADVVPVIIDIKEDSGVIFKSDNSQEVREIVSPETEQGDLIIAQVSESEVKLLEESDAVESVEYSPVFRASLTDSVGIINASMLWGVQVNGINISGIDQTVCIIDSGANFSHPDLLGRNKTCVIDCYGKSCVEDCSLSDDNGHGTHVAGIVAASGAVKGVAPGASIIALRVLDSAGNSHPTDGALDIANAIQWCIQNRTAYNITSISMSLGTVGLYTSYCDNSFTSTITKAVNNATVYNISVVAASGNSGGGVVRNTSAISSPACLSNVSAVSATNKDDSIASYSHYSSIVKLIAPGTSITSTYLSGYALASGTSMATPHVAGAIAIVRQFLQLTNQNKTPMEIESLLNKTGKSISGEGGLIFSRINIYEALQDVSFNYANLVLPADNSNSVRNQTFSCNVSSNLNLTNVTFSIYNSTRLVYNVTNILSGLVNYSNFSYNFSYDDSYKWNCLFFNNGSFYKQTGNFSLSFDLTAPMVTIYSPLNNSWHSSGIFNLSLNENGSCSYSLNRGNNNYSMSSLDNRNFNASNSSLVQSQLYNISYYCNDSLGNLNDTNLIYFNIDQIAPNVTSIYPENGYSVVDTMTISFQYNASDNINLSSCSLILNNGYVASNSSNITNGTNTISYSVSPGSYSWQINCTDVAGNLANSSSRSFTITSSCSGCACTNSCGGGGGGGGGSFVATGKTYTPTSQEVSSGYTGELAKNDKVKFTIFDEKSQEHSVTMSGVTTNSVSLIVASDPIKLTLGIGQSVKLNLTSPYYYNLYIKLEEIVNSKAKLTIQTINDPISIPKAEDKGEIEANKSEIETTKEESSWRKYTNLYSILILSVLVIGFLILRSFRLQIRFKRERSIGQEHRRRHG